MIPSCLLNCACNAIIIFIKEEEAAIVTVANKTLNTPFLSANFTMKLILGSLICTLVTVAAGRGHYY